MMRPKAPQAEAAATATADGGDGDAGGGGVEETAAAAAAEAPAVRWDHLGASAFAGFVGRTLCHPIDTCKARLQATHAPKEFRNTMSVLRFTWREEGLRGLYRGFGVTALGGVPATVVYLTTYDAAKKALLGIQGNGGAGGGSGTFLSYFAAGMLAETLACLVFVPVDVVKERLQVQQKTGGGSSIKCVPGTPQSATYRGSWDALRTIMRHEGLRGIYKGYGATLLSFGPFSALYFVFYENFKDLARYWKRRQPQKGTEGMDFGTSLVASACAGALASFLTNPLDMAKLRLQVQRAMQCYEAPSSGSTGVGGMPPPRIETAEQYRNIWDGLVKMYRCDGGLRGLYRGAGARVMFHTPSTAITMAVYEQVKALLPS